MKSPLAIFSLLVFLPLFAFSQSIQSISPNSGKIYDNLQVTIVGESVDFTREVQGMTPQTVIR